MTTYDTIVIGAGMSGVTAARMLADAGADVIVLEARDRIGGRMHTDRTAGFPVDLGASWVHGIEGSALWDLVQALEIPTLEYTCLLYTSPSPRDVEESRMPSSA